MKKWILQFVVVQLSMLSITQVFAGNSKIDSDGKYLPFPGVTVVALTGDRNRDQFEKLFEALKSHTLIHQYVSLVPVHSYHMTTQNLFVEADAGTLTFQGFIERNLPLISQLKNKIDSNRFKPAVQIVQSRAGGALTLMLKLDPAQDAKLKEISKEFDLTSKLPPFHHITLGYFFKKTPESTKKLITSLVDELVATQFPVGKNELILDEPELNHFLDMTAYYPWDGKHYPFD